jgi:hypothetical protein
MKIKALVALTLAVAVPALSYAKKPKKADTEAPAEAAAPVVEEEDPVITEECIMNVSLFHEAVKNKMYADAYEPWYEVYTTCPNANKSIYTDGDKIVEALYQATSDKAEKERLAKLSIEMQDKRIRFFGNDPKYPKAYVLGEKGLNYIEFFGEAKYAEARECLRASVEGMGVKSKVMVLVKLVDVSYALYKQDPNGKAEQLISDYELAGSALAEQAADATNKNAEIAAKQKDYVDNIFAISGAADCSKLDEIYASVVKENVQNLDMLQRSPNCTSVFVARRAMSISQLARQRTNCNLRTSPQPVVLRWLPRRATMRLLSVTTTKLSSWR